MRSGANGRGAVTQSARGWADWLQPAAFFVLVLLLWEGACRVLDIREYVLPAPTVIAAEIARNLAQLSWHTGITLFEAAAGFLIANVLAFACAVIFTYSRLFERSTYPYLVGLQSVPIVAFAPLITLWLGDGVASKIAMAALITFFPMVVNATVGLKSVDRRALDLMHVLRASEWQIFHKLRMPASVSFVASALKISAPLAVVGAIVAEIAGAASGIGYLILLAAYRVDTPFLFACIIFAAVAGLLFFGQAVLIGKLLLARRQHVRDDHAAVIRLLRAGVLPSSELAESVSREQNQTGIRKRILPGDEAAILKWLESEDMNIVELACTLCAPLMQSGKHPLMRQRLRDMWNGTDASPRWDAHQRYAMKKHILWRLLDDPDIDVGLQSEIKGFIEKHWAHWGREVLEWHDDSPLHLMRHRLASPDFPVYKAWVYLIQASMDPDKPGVCALAREYVDSSHPLVAEVSRRILDNNGFFMETQ